MAAQSPAGQDGLELVPAQDDTLLLRLSGSWRLHDRLPSTERIEQLLNQQRRPRQIAVDAEAITAWDSSLLTFMVKLDRICGESEIPLDTAGLPEGAKRLLKLAAAVPEREGARRQEKATPFLTLVGQETKQAWAAAGELVGFLGESTLVLGKLLVGRARFRRSDLVLIIQECGAQALPIVTLISLLIGMILGFVGAVQLRQFGAQIYVADLVGIAMAREMGAVMTGIIMAGRTGAAFAAQLGTMQVNEEIDALSTLGISAMEFLVLPRMLALILMMPLLCVYADLMGILGGAIVGIGMLDITVIEYYYETRDGVDLIDFAIGIVKAAIFGVLVAIAGCLRGIQCGRSASAVGLAATSAVVTGIVLIVVSDGIFAVVTDVLGI